MHATAGWSRRRPGYLQVIDVDALRAALPAWCCRARVEVAVGDFALPRAPLVALWPAGELDGNAIRRIVSAFAFSTQCNLPQDVLFGVRQLVDIGLKALSPGVNDVTTAVMAVNELGALTVSVVHGSAPATARWRVVELDGRSLLVRTLSIDAFIRAAFDELLLAGREQPRVLSRVREVLRHVAGESPLAGGAVRRSEERLRAVLDGSSVPRALLEHVDGASPRGAGLVHAGRAAPPTQ